MSISLRDNFSDNSISTSAWVAAETGSATAAETSGQIRFTLPSSTAGTHIARLTSRYTQDLTASSFYINIGTMVATGVAATAFFQLYLTALNALQWIQLSGTLYARSIVAGVPTDHYSVAWNATTHKYLRISASGGNVLWETSTNGTSWTTRATVAGGSLFTVTEVWVDFGATCGNIASPGSFRLDDVNLILPALSTNWRYTWARRALVNRHKRTTIAIDTADTAQGYLITADGMDASNLPSGSIRYWSGPAGGGRLLTEQASEADAQAMAVNLPADGTFDLPEMVDMRLVWLAHRSIDGAAYNLMQFYPRRVVQTDDFEAESVRALHIAANQIKAGHLEALMVISNTISTDYNGARVTLSGDAFGGLIGYGAADTYNTLTGVGSYQILWSKADGKFYFGGGNGLLDDGGISVELTSSVFGDRAYRLVDSGGIMQSSIQGTTTAADHAVYMRAESLASKDSRSEVLSRAPSGKQSVTALDAVAGSVGARLAVYVSSGTPIIDIGDNTAVVTIAAGLNVGTATGAAAGEISTSGSVAAGVAISPNVRLFAKGEDTSTTKYAMFAQDSAAATKFYVRNDGLVFGDTLLANSYRIGAVQVVGARITGWNAPTTGGGGLLRGTFDTGATLVTTARTLAAVIADLRTHGLLGT